MGYMITTKLSLRPHFYLLDNPSTALGAIEYNALFGRKGYYENINNYDNKQ
jgi:hypothetical protein